MVKKPGRPATADNNQSFQITVSKAAYAYLCNLARTTNMGGTANAVAAFIVSNELEKMRLSGSYPQEIPQIIEIEEGPYD